MATGMENLKSSKDEIHMSSMCINNRLTYKRYFHYAIGFPPESDLGSLLIGTVNQVYKLQIISASGNL